MANTLYSQAQLVRKYRNEFIAYLSMMYVLAFPIASDAQTATQCFYTPSLCQGSVKPPSPGVSSKKKPKIAEDSVKLIFDGFDIETRKSLQKALMKLGLYDSGIDGRYGGKTRAALKRYLNQEGVKESSASDVTSVLSILANLENGSAQVSFEELAESEGVDRDKAELFISDIENYVSNNQSNFDLNFSIEFGKVRKIKDGEWNQTLQNAFNRFREYALADPGFSKFHESRNNERQAEFSVKLSSTKKSLSEHTALMRSWAQANLLDQRTEEVVKFISNSDEVMLTNNLEVIEDTLAVANKLSLEIGVADLTSLDTKKATPFVPDSIYLYGNFTGSAPHLFKGISGEPELSGNNVEICLVGAFDKWQRYAATEFISKKLKAENIAVADAACFGSEDVLVVLGSRLIEGDLPPNFSTGYEDLQRLDRKDSVSTKEKFDLVSEIYEDDILKGQKNGFGLLRFDGDNEEICSIIEKNFQDHGIALMSSLEIVSLYGAELQKVAFANDVLDSFRRAQKGECGFVYGNAEDLATLVEAAKNNKLVYDVLPIWISPETVEQITIMRTEDEKQRLIDQASRESQQVLDEQALEAAMQKASVAQDILRSENEVRFSAVIDKLSAGVLTGVDFGFSHSPLDSNYQELYRNLDIIDVTTGNSSVFDSIINDIQVFSLEKWEKTGFILNKMDYGAVDYNGRTLEGVISELQVSMKNRIVGDFMTYCRIIRAVNDTDFDMWRQIEISECELDDGQWRLANGFESKWIVSTEQ
jgi:peptidoglycan hydrolase-like protein with peptidoglycan-binding domain/uncharacterized protein (DUF1778 family)